MKNCRNHLKNDFWRVTGIVFLFVMVLSIQSFAGHGGTTDYKIITVKSGDTISYMCFKLYKKYTPRIGQALLQHNTQLRDINRIYVGQTIKFPRLSVLLAKYSPATEKAAEKQTDQTVSSESPEVKVPDEVPVPDKVMPTVAPNPILPQNETNEEQGAAYITYLKGDVQYKPSAEKSWKKALPNTQLFEGDQLRVNADGKAEIITDDDHVIRLNQNSVLTINKLKNNPVEKIRKSGFLLSLGSLWHKARKLIHPQSEFKVYTPNAISGIRGTVYSIDVQADHNVRFRTYEGSINVYNQNSPENKLAMPENAQPSVSYPTVQAPHNVPGPHNVSQPHLVSKPQPLINPQPMVHQQPVAGPHTMAKPHILSAPQPISGPQEVSMETWTRILLKKQQELQVDPQGKVHQKPFSFDSLRNDTWVQWNTERDKDFASSQPWQ